MNFSRFNIYIQKENALLIYNTLQGKVASIGSPHFETVDLESLKRNPADVLEFLSANKFVCDSEEEEKALLLCEQKVLEAAESRLNITLLPSLACNFRCFYCYEDHGQHDQLKKRDYEALERGIIESGIKDVDFELFGGEPLLFRYDLLSFISKIKESDGIRVHGGITTNGYLLEKDIFDDLLSVGINRFQITLDGNKERHDRIRHLRDGKGSYEAIWENILAMKESEKAFRAVIRCNLEADDTIDSFLDDYVSRVGSDPRFSLLLFPVMSWGGGNACGESFSQSDIFRRYVKRLKALKVKDANFDHFLKGTFSCTYEKPNGMTLLPNGAVGFCTIDLHPTISTIDEYFSHRASLNTKKLEGRCQRKECKLYPRCFGFRCGHVERGGASCQAQLETLKDFLKEYYL